MRRIAVVVVAALLTALVSGVTDASWAQQPENDRALQARREALLARLAEIPAGAVVRIERVNGVKIAAVLEEVGSDSITVVIPKGDDRTRLTIPIDEIRKVDEVRGHALRNVLIGFGVTAAVLVGLCASSLNSN